MFDLHMHIYNELVNPSLHWHSPKAPSWHAPTKHVSISMGDLGKPPRYEGSSNCRPCRGAQLVNSEGESISLKPFSSHLKVCQLVCYFKNSNMCNLDICCFDAFDGLHVIGVTHLGWQFQNKNDNNESSTKEVMVNQKPT
jgi:hypothetical protein